MLIASSYRRRWKWLWRTARQRWKALGSALILLWLFLIFEEQKHPFTKHAHAITFHSLELEQSYIPPTSPDSAAPPKSNHRVLLPLDQAKEFCQHHAFQPYPTRTLRHKVYDLIMINDELDMLEIRLNTLSAHVDYFVIVESSSTFTGRAKPLALKENWARFKEFHSQIIYHKVEDMPIGAKRSEEYEEYQRNAIYQQVIPGLRKEQAANVGDILVVSDVDEIPRPTTITVLRNCNIPKRLTLRSQFFYYSFQWQRSAEEWAYPKATIYLGPGRTILPADLRYGRGGHWISAWWQKADLWNSGWHCSTCLENISEVLLKLSSSSDTRYNNEHFRDRTRIVDRVRKGLDLYDRPEEDLSRVSDNQDIPEYLKAHPDSYRYLLDRDAWNAGFSDYGEHESAPD